MVMVMIMTCYVLLFFFLYRTADEKVSRGVFDTNTMLSHFTELQEKHRNYQRTINSGSQLDKAIAKIDLQ